MVRADDSDMILMLIYFLILDLIFELTNCVKVKITESFGQFWLNLLQRSVTERRVNAYYTGMTNVSK